jgi:hypothetical protein
MTRVGVLRGDYIYSYVVVLETGDRYVLDGENEALALVKHLQPDNTLEVFEVTAEIREIIDRTDEIKEMLNV